MGKKVSFAAKPKKAAAVPKAADNWVSSGDPREKDEPKPVDKVAMKRFTVDIPVDLHIRMKVSCTKRGLKMADEMRRLIENEFPEEG